DARSSIAAERAVLVSPAENALADGAGVASEQAVVATGRAFATGGASGNAERRHPLDGLRSAFAFAHRRLGVAGPLAIVAGPVRGVRVLLLVAGIAIGGPGVFPGFGAAARAAARHRGRESEPREKCHVPKIHVSLLVRGTPRTHPKFSLPARAFRRGQK